MKKNLASLETNVKFSQSILWQLQREYFSNFGIKAWVRGVPFFVTSNTYIANAYAQFIINFIQDYLAKNADAKEFYILELGAGSGQLSFYCLKKILELKEILKLSVKIKYIISDFAEKNVNFWQKQEVFQQFIADDILDFALYDIEEDKTVKLIRANKELHTDTPLIVIANYVIDSVKNDAFATKNSKLCESLLTCKSPYFNIVDSKVKDLNKVTTYFNDKEITDLKNYYSCDIYNKILQEYQGLANGNFLFPVGIFYCLETLKKISNNKLVLLTTDKGYKNKEDIIDRAKTNLIFHGSFSLTVNFHAVASYFKQHEKSITLCQDTTPEISSNVFMMGVDADILKNSKIAFQNFFNTIGPGDYFRLHRFLREQKQQIDSSRLITQLRLNDFDPYVISIHLKTLLAYIQQNKKQTYLKKSLQIGLKKAAKNIYSLPSMTNHYYSIAILYYAMENYESAINMLKKAVAWQTQDDKYSDTIYDCYYTLGLCHKYLKELDKAKNYLQLATQMPQDLIHQDRAGKQLKLLND
mgnify:CR=1 FL=1